MALDGKHFFYVNPLETYPKSIPHNHGLRPYKTGSPALVLAAPAAPENIARTLVAIGHYLFTPRRDALFINFYAERSAVHQ